MADFDKLAVMKPGDIFYECEYGTNIEARVLSIPVVGSSTFDEKTRRTLKWEAENTQNGEPISYRLTEGLDHYGPRIYDQPQYGCMKGGEFVYPLVGASSHD